MRIAIVNQFAPPDEAPTSVLAGELAEHLRARGHEVELIACDSGYRGKRKPRGGRMVHEVRAHLSLFWRCLRYRDADLLLALSSPACLPVTVSLAARLKRCGFAHWAMDVYPQVATALAEIRTGGLIDRLTSRAMRSAYRHAAPLVALDRDMADVLQPTASKPPEICPPWPPSRLGWPTDDTPPGGPFTWLYSGNLGRAHEWQPLLLAQQILEQRGVPARLVFQGRGHALPAAAALAAELGLERCEFRDYAPREGMLATLFDANLLVATQVPATRGLLWPSKLAVIEHVPRPLLWVGDAGCQIARDLSARGRGGVFAPDDPEAIADWIETLVSDPPALAYQPPPAPRAALQQWESWLTTATAPLGEHIPNPTPST